MSYWLSVSSAGKKLALHVVLHFFDTFNMMACGARFSSFPSVLPCCKQYTNFPAVSPLTTLQVLSNVQL